MTALRSGLAAILVLLTVGCDDGPDPAPASPFALPSDGGVENADREPAVDGASSDAAADPPAPAAIAGIRGLRVDGTIEFEDGAEPTVAKTLRRWSFPDRSRVDTTWPELGAQNRTRFQRFGSRAWFLGVGELEPMELTAEDGARALFDAALDRVATDVAYRAVLLWPDGFEWTDEPDGSRSASVDDSVAGVLRVAARPPAADDDTLVIDVANADGPLVNLVASGRYQHPTRRFPTQVRVQTRSGRWTESFDRIDPRAVYLDVLFEVAAPPSAAPSDGATTFVRVARVPRRPWRRWALDEPHSDLARARERASELLNELGPTSAEWADAVFELDDRARFTAVVLRLHPGHDAPSGFEPGRPSSSVGVEVDPNTDGELLRAVQSLSLATGGPASGPGVPYLVELAGNWQVVLPIPHD